MRDSGSFRDKLPRIGMTERLMACRKAATRRSIILPSKDLFESAFDKPNQFGIMHFTNDAGWRRVIFEIEERHGSSSLVL